MFDDEKIFTPASWEEESAVVESVNETEAGTDQIIVTRYDKLSVSASFQCSSTWAGKFKAYSKRDSVAVRMYDLETHGYVEREMRLRGFKAVPAEHSERTSGTDGLWTVSFTLEEF
jgi:hypothetical protein